MESKSKELFLRLKVLLKEYCPAAFGIGVLVRGCNWAGRDPGSEKKGLGSAGVLFVGYAFFGGGSMGECGVHQDIGGCSGHMAALALSNARLYSH